MDVPVHEIDYSKIEERVMGQMPAESLARAAEAISKIQVQTLEQRNALVQSVDAVMEKAFPGNPDHALGTLMLCQVLSMRRLIEKHRLDNRGHRHRVIRAAVAEFDKKLRQFL